MQTSVDFVSKMFRPYLPEAAQVNPGRYGFELALWISQQLAQRGVMTSYPQYEDWGWFVEYHTDEGHEYWLCCGSRDGLSDSWECFLDPKAKSLFGRNKAPVEGASAMMHALRDLLAQEPGITNLRWE
jgi:hypothetical protein